MKRVSIFVFLIALLSVRGVLGAQSPVGKWKTVDEKSGKVTSEVEIYERSSKLFGKIAGFLANLSGAQRQAPTRRKSGQFLHLRAEPLLFARGGYGRFIGK